MRARRALIRKPGGTEAIDWEELDLPAPGPGEVRMRNTAIGLNFIDTYHRRGIYPLALPSGLGMEAAGVVEAAGSEACGFKPGDRVCTFGPLPGAYCTARNIPAAQLFRTPAAIADELAAAALLKACTAEFLVERCARIEAGWTVLVHAAAGGVGLLLVQWLKHVGVRVIATVGSDAKVALARTAGADEVIVYSREDTAARVRELTGGEGVRVTFDGVGRDAWQASLDATGRRGLIVNYGAASGATGAIDPGVLAIKGSLFNTRPTLWDYYHDSAERAAGADRVFSLLQAGVLSVSINQRFRLDQAAQAHEALEARRTTGSSVLLP